MTSTTHRLWPWFDRGARAAEIVFPHLSRGYLCPLCLNHFPPESLTQDLPTSDHVPPESLGGHRLVLTCRRCNSRAGSDLDIAMLQYDQRLDYDFGLMPEDARIPGKLTVDGKTVNVEIRAIGSNVTVFDLPRHNHPTMLGAVDAELRRQKADEAIDTIRLELHYPRHSPDMRTVQLGWLRAGYLAACAVFGYRYITSPALSVVRQQLAHPEANLIGQFLAVDARSTRERSHWELLGILEPDPIRCVLVRVGRYCVLLPPLEAGPDFYEGFDRTMLAQKSQQGLLNQILLHCPWPREPQHLMDVPIEELLELADRAENSRA